MTVAIFDLDYTLLAGDSDYAWGQFLIEHHIVDGEEYRRRNDQYYADYQAGRLDIMDFLAFALAPLAAHERAQLDAWHQQYMREKILPMITNAARELVEKHRAHGDTLVIATSTNSFVTGPIAREFGVEHLIATEPEEINGRFTGRVQGTPCYREGKVTRLKEWLATTGQQLAGSYGYSDSHNDLPLLSLVDQPVAVNPDPILAQHAATSGWPVMHLH